MNVKKVGCEDVDWIYLTQHGCQWYSLVKCGNELQGIS